MKRCPSWGNRSSTSPCYELLPFIPAHFLIKIPDGDMCKNLGWGCVINIVEGSATQRRGLVTDHKWKLPHFCQHRLWIKMITQYGNWCHVGYEDQQGKWGKTLTHYGNILTHKATEISFCFLCLRMIYLDLFIHIQRDGGGSVFHPPFGMAKTPPHFLIKRWEKK